MAEINQHEGFEPLQDRILVQPDEALTRTAGGIIIPETQEETPNQGTIIAVSKEALKRKVGEKVLYGQYSGFEVSVGGKKFRLIREDDAYAILHK
jgi:chaperonin GroES